MKKATRDPQGDADRRSTDRLVVNAEGELKSCAQFARSQPMAVKVCDVSPGGLGIVHSEPLPSGTQYVVKQASFSPEQPRLYTVTRSKVKQDGTFVIGLQASQPTEPIEATAAPMPAPKRVHKPLTIDKNFGATGMIVAVLVLMVALAFVLYKASI